MKIIFSFTTLYSFVFSFNFLLADSHCPSNYFYQSDLDMCLFYPGVSDTWMNARSICDFNGGYLLSIHNAFQNGIMTQIQSNLTGDTKGWLGAWSLNSNWTWVDGTPMNYQKFTQPANDSQCAYLDRSDSFWKSVTCQSRYKFLCATPTLQCASPTDESMYHCRSGWQSNSKTGYQYLVFFNKNFTEGESYCLSQGAHLASIHSDDENNFITNLCCTTSITQRSQDGNLAEYLVGGYRKNGSNAWTDGTPFDYNHSSCSEGSNDGDHLKVMSFQANGYSCGTPGLWLMYHDQAQVYPYLVCKKKK